MPSIDKLRIAVEGKIVLQIKVALLLKYRVSQEISNIFIKYYEYKWLLSESTGCI